MGVTAKENDNPTASAQPEEETLNRDALEMIFRTALAREAGKRASGMVIKRLFVSR